MVNLKAVRNKIRSIASIQKITKSMKMVSTTKFAKAEQSLGNIRQTFSTCANMISQLNGTDHNDNILLRAKISKNNSDSGMKSLEGLSSNYGCIVLLSSDKGLCGQIHSSVFKYARNLIDHDKSYGKLPLITIGDRIGAFAKNLPNRQVLHFNNIGSKMPSFNDAHFIVDEIFKLSTISKSFDSLDVSKGLRDGKSDFGSKLDIGNILLIHNRFVNMIRFETLHQSIIGPNYFDPSFMLHKTNDATSENSKNLQCSLERFETSDLDEDQKFAFAKFIATCHLHCCMGLALSAELSSRISCMENSTKNAGQMLDKLTLVYNRTRQAVITNELMEIISGASASAAKK